MNHVQDWTDVHGSQRAPPHDRHDSACPGCPGDAVSRSRPPADLSHVTPVNLKSDLQELDLKFFLPEYIKKQGMLQKLDSFLSIVVSMLTEARLEPASWANNVCLCSIQVVSAAQLSGSTSRLSDRFAELQPQTNELKSPLSAVSSVVGAEVSIR